MIQKKGEKKASVTSLRLTLKQEKFCLEYLTTGNASEAYRRSYDTSNMKPESITRKAKELMDNVKITARITELKRPAEEKALITYESHLKRLEELSRGAESAEQFSAAINAEIHRGKAAGLYSGQQGQDNEICLEINRGTVDASS